MRRVTRKSVFAYTKTKAQISCAVIATEKDYLETNWSLVADWTSRRQVDDWSAVSRRQVAISF